MQGLSQLGVRGCRRELTWPQHSPHQGQHACQRAHALKPQPGGCQHFGTSSRGQSSSRVRHTPRAASSVRTRFLPGPPSQSTTRVRHLSYMVQQSAPTKLRLNDNVSPLRLWCCSEEHMCPVSGCLVLAMSTAQALQQPFRRQRVEVTPNQLRAALGDGMLKASFSGRR